MKTVHVIQGDCSVSSDADVVFSTVLGSCIAVCMRDPVMGIAGMNHFLLPGDGSSENTRYGTHSMEVLINGLLRAGALRSRLEAKVFGGASMSARIRDIGRENADFVLRFLNDEEIPCLSKSVGGNQARRVRFWVANGKVKQLLVGAADIPPPKPAAPQPMARENAGELELF